MTEAVIFDMDGLLIDSEPFWREAEKQSFEEIGVTLTEAMCEAAMGLRISEVIEHWYHKFPWSNPDFLELERTILQRVSDRITTHGTLMRGVQETLQFFRQRSVPMALASASPKKLIDTFLDKFNLHSFFKVVHSAEQEAYGKPHPAVFLTTAQKMNIHPVRILVFEDSFNGMIAAKAARMKIAVVPDPKHQNQPRWIIADQQLSSLSEWNEDLWKKIKQ
jgi:sugar-phosphatase